ncbi:alanine--tRNA ligase [Candidatus Gottesmanbacteria bacterium]|nr:alanine--tRNA ligase [Candidatus Gottesmanbacteria bacterium]
MKSADVRRKFIEFYTSRGHAEVPSAPLVPEGDSSSLFISSGMQPLVPFLLGARHPSGDKLVNSQKCIRVQDIEEVGDNRHTTFFEMLGNWSLGDYFKEKQLPWIWEFLTKELNLDPKKLFVSVFEGTKDVSRDEESVEIWKRLGVPDERIFFYGVKKNWWSRSGEPAGMPPGEPGGPDSEVFYDFGVELGLHERSNDRARPCHPNCDCGRFMEIANSVFMQYQKQADGSLKELTQKNVDFGGGLERLVAATQSKSDIFDTDLFTEIIKAIEVHSSASYGRDEHKSAIRVIADHLKAATFLMADGVIPSNKTQGYILRRLLRRSAVKMHRLRGGLTPMSFQAICDVVLRTYDGVYFDRSRSHQLVDSIIEEEMDRFGRSLDRGLKEFDKAKEEQLNALFAFNLFQTHGFPFEITEELFKQKDRSLDKEEFNRIYRKHQNLSRTSAAGMFKGGLADQSEKTTKLHTAHHILLAALQKIIDPSIKQRGSNITAERLRMDFNYAKKLTPEELTAVEKLVNEKIQENLPVMRVEMPREEAEKLGAQMEFGHKYPERVSVYFVGPEKNFFSAEFCGGPHISDTGSLGTFHILKEESAGAGVRRIYAELNK